MFSFKRKMKTFLPKPKKTTKRRNSPHFVVARSKVGGIGTDSNDANILIERLKKKTRTKKAKVEKVEKIKVEKVKKEKKVKTEKIVKPTRKTSKKTKKVKLVIVEEFAEEQAKPVASPFGKKIENQNIVEERVTTPKT